MRKQVWGVVVFSFILLVFSIHFSSALDSAKLGKASVCLNGKVNSSTGLTLEQATFAGLAGITDLHVNTTIQNSMDASKKCWPSSGCMVKETAQVILAKSQTQQNTSSSEKWIESQTGASTDLNWFLQITGDEPTMATTCHIRYNDVETNYDVHILSDMTLQESGAGNCLTTLSNKYWLGISATVDCLNTTFHVQCDEQDFKTNLLYQKKSGGTVYVSATTNSGNKGGWTQEKVGAFCFLKNGACDYESTLWATMALYKAGSRFQNDVGDYQTYVPYLKVLAEDHDDLFPSAFLMSLIGRGRNDIYYSDVQKRFLSDPNGGFWPHANGATIDYYMTSLGILGLGGGSSGDGAVQKAETYLFKKQDAAGCWNNGDIRDTAFLVYVLGGVQTSSTGVICSNGVDANGNCLPASGSGGPDLTGQNCSLVSNTACRATCNSNETSVSATCDAAGTICCQYSSENNVPLQQSSCEQAANYCAPDEISCLQAGGQILDLYSCSLFTQKCCSVSVQALPNCASKGGNVCADNQACSDSGAIVQASDGACCVSPAICKTRTTNICQSDSDCGVTQQCQNGACVAKAECNSNSDCSSGRVCTNGSCVISSSSGSSTWLWITLFVILIGLVVLGIVYKDKLRLWLFKKKDSRGREPPRGSGWPPSSGGANAPPMMRRGPPRFGPPTTMRPVPQRAPARPAPQSSRAPSAKDKEMEETLKKLKEISG